MERLDVDEREVVERRVVVNELEEEELDDQRVLVRRRRAVVLAVRHLDGDELVHVLQKRREPTKNRTRELKHCRVWTPAVRRMLPRGGVARRDGRGKPNTEQRRATTQLGVATRLHDHDADRVDDGRDERAVPGDGGMAHTEEYWRAFTLAMRTRRVRRSIGVPSIGGAFDHEEKT